MMKVQEPSRIFYFFQYIRLIASYFVFIGLQQNRVFQAKPTCDSVFHFSIRLSEYGGNSRNETIMSIINLMGKK